VRAFAHVSVILLLSIAMSVTVLLSQSNDFLESFRTKSLLLASRVSVLLARVRARLAAASRSHAAALQNVTAAVQYQGGWGFRRSDL
jgi:hypothetical protein